MRAYLSDREARQALHSSRDHRTKCISGCMTCFDASHEARRILADVEPVNLRPGCDDSRCWCYQTTTGHSNIGPLAMFSGAYQTLAESLTAFLAAPDPAAYLRSKQ